MTLPRFIDVSRYQGDIDWRQVKASGRIAGIAKLTEGVTFTDPSGAANLRAIRVAGLIPGAYHFLRRESDPIAQANHFLTELQDALGSWNGCVLMVDVETAEPSMTNPTMTQVKAFCGWVEARVGRPGWVYLPRWWYNAHAAGETGPLSWGLVVSDYSFPSPDHPGRPYGGWARFVAWQYTSIARVPGVSGNCDDNYFYGTPAELAAWAKGGSADMALDADAKTYIDSKFEAIAAQLDRAVQRVGGRTNTRYNNTDPDFTGLVMAKDLAAQLEAAQADIEAIKQQLATGTVPPGVFPSFTITGTAKPAPEGS